MLNVIALCGRMVRDPEVKRIGDRSCCNFTIAVERDYKSKGEKITDFFDCTAHSRLCLMPFLSAKSIQLRFLRICTGIFLN